MASDCRSGYELACAALGKDWERAGNTVRARDAYRRACDAGQLESCTTLARSYKDSKDRAHAAALFTRPATAESRTPAVNSARWREGRSARQEEPLAVQGNDVVKGATVDACYFAAQDQNGKECVALGVAYESATSPDLRRAADAYHWACDCDHDGGEGCRRFADALGAGRGVKADAAIAAQWYERGCKSRDATSCAIFGELVAKGKSGQTRDAVHAVTLYEEACDGGAADGCALLAEMLEKGTGIDSNAARAVALYGQACDAGSTRGCNDLGLAYASGKGSTAPTPSTCTGTAASWVTRRVARSSDASESHPRHALPKASHDVRRLRDDGAEFERTARSRGMRQCVTEVVVARGAAQQHPPDPSWARWSPWTARAPSPAPWRSRSARRPWRACRRPRPSQPPVARAR